MVLNTLKCWSAGAGAGAGREGRTVGSVVLTFDVPVFSLLRAFLFDFGDDVSV